MTELNIENDPKLEIGDILYNPRTGVKSKIIGVDTNNYTVTIKREWRILTWIRRLITKLMKCIQAK